MAKVGLVAYLVTSVEGLLLFDLPRLEWALPPQLNVESLAGNTTTKLGHELLAHASQCIDPTVAAYLEAGGIALSEIGSQRNAVLHARPATDKEGRTRLYRWRCPMRTSLTTTGWINLRGASTTCWSNSATCDRPSPQAELWSPGVVELRTRIRDRDVRPVVRPVGP